MTNSGETFRTKSANVYLKLHNESFLIQKIDIKTNQNQTILNKTQEQSSRIKLSFFYERVIYIFFVR